MSDPVAVWNASRPDTSAWTLTYYHVTPRIVWEEKIQSEGLVPQIGERSKKVHEPNPAVFLFESEDSMEDALFSWLGDEFDDDLELVLLRVKPPVGTTLDEAICCEGEVRCYDTIPPECIEFVELL